jgi:hypothetical protein
MVHGNTILKSPNIPIAKRPWAGLRINNDEFIGSLFWPLNLTSVQ